MWKGLHTLGIYITKSIRLAHSWKRNKKNCATVPFVLCFILYLRATSKYNPPEAFNRRGDLTEGLLRYKFIQVGAYFRVVNHAHGAFRFLNVLELFGITVKLKQRGYTLIEFARSVRVSEPCCR